MKKKALGNSVVVFWTISYVVIFCIPMFACLFMYQKSSETIRDQLVRAGTLTLQTVREQMDTEIQQVMADSFELRYQNDFGWILELDDFADADPVRLRQTVNLLRDVEAMRASVDGVYLYFHASDTIISHVSTQSAAQYFEYYESNYTDVDKQTWLDLVTGKYTGQMAIRSITMQSPADMDSFTFCLQTITPPDGGEGYNIIIQLSNERLEGLRAYHEYGQDNQHLYFVDQQGNILYENNAVPHSEETITQISLDTDDYIETQIDQNHYVIIQMDSAVLPFKYLMMVSQEAFYDQLATMRAIIAMAALLAVVVGVGLTMLMVRINYNPLRRLLAGLRGGSAGGLGYRENEYKLIESALKALNTQNSEMNQKVHQQARLLKNAFVGRLLHGTERSEMRIRDLMNQHGIEFPHPYFAVVSVAIDEYNPDILLNEKEQAEQTSIRNYLSTERLMFVISNVMEELFGNSCFCQTTITDMMVNCVCNLKTNKTEGFYRMVNEATGQLSVLMRNNFECEVTVAASDIMGGIPALANAYSQVTYTLEYSQSFNEGQAVFYAQVQPPDGLYFIPEGTKRQITSCLEEGNTAHITALVDEIFTRNLSGKHGIGLDAARFLAADLINTLLKATDITQSSDGEKLNQFMARARDVLACKKLEQLQHMLHETVIMYLDLLDSNDEVYKPGDSLSQTLAAYVYEHYSDFGLSNASIGEAFGVNPSYASRVIRKEFGVGLLDFINSYRIDCAKKLLASEETITIEELAQRVGFATAKTFTRCFKKFTGVTPGKWRKDAEDAACPAG